MKLRSNYWLKALALFSIFLPFHRNFAQREHDSPPFLNTGIVVESLTAHGEGHNAGMRAGDVLLSWTGATSKGEIKSPFDLPFLGFEEAPSGPIRFEGLRGGRKRVWLLRRIPWGIATRPNITGSSLAAYLEAENLAHSGRLTDAIEIWKGTAARAQGSEVAWLRAWFLSHGAEMLFRVREMDGSDQLYRQAIDTAADSGPVVRGELFRQWASQLEFREDFVRAEEYYRDELAEWKQLHLELLIAKTLNELGTLLSAKGDFVKAESCFLESLAISRKLAPAANQSVVSHNNLAVLYQERGELGKAEKYYRLALEIGRKSFPETYYLSGILNDFGTLSLWRGNPSQAEEYQREALAIAKKLHLSLFIADILDSFSDCRLARGDLSAAERYQKRALAIREQSDAKLPVAASLGALGRIARMQGHLDIAEHFYHRALETADNADPTSPQRSTFLSGLGDVFLARGNLEEAERNFREALAIVDHSAPRSLEHVDTLASLGATLHREGRIEEASSVYRQTLADFEYQTATLEAVETQARYRAKHQAYYREFIDLLIEEGQSSLAFETLESSRARALIEMLRMAQIDIREGADAALLARERELGQSLHARSQYRLHLLNEQHTDQQMEDLDRDIANLHERYQQVEAEIRISSPKYATLTQPQPLGLKDIQGLLDPGTVVLEYALGNTHSYVWVVGVDSLEVRVLPGRSAIESVARQFYRAVTARTRNVSADRTQEVARWNEADISAQRLGRRLSEIVLTPVSALLRGKRLLIVSDGALAYVPFSALSVPEEPDVPLLVKHEIVNLPSASVLAEIRRASEDRPKPMREVAVLADPVFDLGDPRVVGNQTRHRIDHDPGKLSASQSLSPSRWLSRSAADVGKVQDGSFHLERLTYTRDEAWAIITVARSGGVFQALDFKASRLTAMNPDLARSRIVHFATHGLLDSKRPEFSGLVLSLVDRHGKSVDGFLDLEDIYNLSLPVELVVLSGCQTGLGEEISGEGLIGLTRGFIYAGASRVVASLWNVSDMATAKLMADFYRAMERDGMRPAAALRAAQIKMWKQQRWSSPYYWAAFQIQGEWR